jgi:hypothetical protein
MAVTLYRQVGKGKARRYQKVNLGRGRRPADLTGPYFLRYSLADGTRPWELVGDDLDSAIDSQKRKQAFFEALDANVPVIQNQDETGRTKITDAVYQCFAELQLFQAKTSRERARRRCGHTTTASDSSSTSQRRRTCFLDQIDRTQLLRTCGLTLLVCLHRRSGWSSRAS